MTRRYYITRGVIRFVTRLAIGAAVVGLFDCYAAIVNGVTS